MTVSTAVLRQAALSVAAYRRIKAHLVATPCLPSRQRLSGNTALYFKAENFQHTGSFKFRGAMAKLTALAADTPVVTASSGNHGLALATAARLTGHQLTVVLPTTVAREKLSRIQALGVDVVLHSDNAGKAEQHARVIARESAKVYVSPYNDEDVIAGQGSIAIELLEQLPELDVIFVSIGGGGLISGIGSVVKAFAPRTRVIGVSAENSAELAASMRAGGHVNVEHQETLADGCAGAIETDSLTLKLASEVVDELIDCSEESIANGVRALAWTEKMLVEGSAGLALAPWLDDRAAYAGLTSAVVLCGANFDREVIGPVICG